MSNWQLAFDPLGLGKQKLQLQVVNIGNDRCAMQFPFPKS
jgi:hypothetical protein